MRKRVVLPGPPSSGILRWAVVVGALLAIPLQTLSIWDLPSAETDLAIFHAAAAMVERGDSIYAVRFWAGYWTWPPFGALALLPLALLNLETARALWTLVSIGALIWTVWNSLATATGRDRYGLRPWLRLCLGVLVCLALTPVADALGLGQVGLMFVALTFWDLNLVRSHHRWAGVALGLCTAMKLITAPFIVLLFVVGEWRVALRACASIGLAWLLAALVMPQDSWRYFSTGLALRTNELIGGYGSSSMNQSLPAILARHLPVGAEALSAVLSILIASWSLHIARKYWINGQHHAAFAVIGMTITVLSPISWHHHAVWVVPTLILLSLHAVSVGEDLALVVITMLLMVPARLVPPEWADYFGVTCIALLVWLWSWTTELAER